jgi:hypothetical protein
MPTKWILLFCLVCLVGCRQEAETDSGIVIDWTISPDPPQTGPVTFEFTLTDEAGEPISASNIRMEANMTHPGMQPVLASAIETSEGRYESEFEFTMPGDWYILIDGELPGGGRFQKQVNVAAVRSM